MITVIFSFIVNFLTLIVAFSLSFFVITDLNIYMSGGFAFVASLVGICVVMCLPVGIVEGRILAAKNAAEKGIWLTKQLESVFKWILVIVALIMAITFAIAAMRDDLTSFSCWALGVTAVVSLAYAGVFLDDKKKNPYNNTAPQGKAAPPSNTPPPSGSFGSYLEKLNAQKIQSDRVLVANSISPEKLEKICKAYGSGLSLGDIVLVVDDTVFRDADDGFIVTNDAIMTKELFQKSSVYPFSSIKAISRKGKTLLINGSSVIDLNLVERDELSRVDGLLNDYLKKSAVLPTLQPKQSLASMPAPQAKARRNPAPAMPSDSEPRSQPRVHEQKYTGPLVSIMPGMDMETGLSRRLPIYVLINTSIPMEGEPIQAVSVGLRALLSALRQDPYALESAQMSFITFDNTIKEVLPLTPVAALQIHQAAVSEEKHVMLSKALRYLSEKISHDLRKSTADAKGDWRPLVFILTDGTVTDVAQLDSAMGQLAESGIGSMVICLAGPHADASLMQPLSAHVVELESMNTSAFASLFKWASVSVSANGVEPSHGASCPLPAPPPEINLVP